MEYHTNYNFFLGQLILLVIGILIIIIGNVDSEFSDILFQILIFLLFLILYSAYHFYVQPIKIELYENSLTIHYYYKKYNLNLNHIKVRENEKHTRTGSVYHQLKIKDPSQRRSFKIDSFSWTNYEHIKKQLITNE